MHQLLLGATLVSTGTVIGALFSNTTNAAQPLPSSLPAAVPAMPYSTSPSLAKVEAGSYMLTPNEYVAATWIG